MISFLITKHRGHLFFRHDYMNKRPPDVRPYYGTTPRFEDDQKCLPLQGADLWAWWVPEWYEEDANTLPEKMDQFDFGTWKGKRRPYVTFGFDEHQIFQGLMQVAFDGFREHREALKKQK